MAGILNTLFGSSPDSSRSPHRRTPSSGSASLAPSEQFSLARLQQLWQKLAGFRESDLEVAGGDAIVETVRQITEAIIWGEQHDPHLFDFFCEKNILADFIKVLGMPRTPSRVRVQLLQTLSILVQNIRRSTSLYYLLSNNYVNRLIATPLDFGDEEQLCYYITFLKSLAMRLDRETINFFFIQFPECHFPLYIEATKFFSHREQMIRASVRTITLKVYSIEDQAMRNYVKRHAAQSYFGQLAHHLRELWLRLDAAVAGVTCEQEMDRVLSENELQSDFLIYLSDMFELEIADINEVLADRLLTGALLPMLLGGINQVSVGGDVVALPPAACSNGQTASDTADTQLRVLSPAVALFLLRQVLETCRSKVLLEPLANAMLLPMLDPTLAYALPQVDTQRPPSLDHLDGVVPNTFREHFLGCLAGSSDSVFILAVASIHSCVLNREAFPSSFLVTARIMPGPSTDSTCTSSSATRANGMEVEAEDPPVSCGPFDLECIEVLLLLLHGLKKHATWQLETFQALCRMLLDIFLDPMIVCHAQCLATIRQALCAALRDSAQLVRHHLHETAFISQDAVLDMFYEEWGLHLAPAASALAICNNPSCLLLGMEPTRQGQGHGSQQGASAASKGVRRSLRSFLELRRLAEDMERFSMEVQQQRLVLVDPSETPTLAARQRPWHQQRRDILSPLRLEGADNSNWTQGDTIQIGSFDHIVCEVLLAAPGKDKTRYLLLCDFTLVLVAPDMNNTGLALLTTLWPIWQVQCFSDRGEPRLLRLALRTTAASQVPEDVDGRKLEEQRLDEQRGSKSKDAYFTISLSFKDVGRCHAAATHLQRCHNAVRGQLRHQVAAYVERYCTEPLTDLLSNSSI